MLKCSTFSIVCRRCIHARPSELQLVIYASQAAAGIFHIHKAGILHRCAPLIFLFVKCYLIAICSDIACRNMLVDSGRVRVSDFGLSRSLAVVQVRVCAPQGA